VLVVRKDRLNAARGMVQMFGFNKVDHIIVGGSSRQQSVAKGLDVLDEDTKIVSVHDGARPCLQAETISDTIKAAKRYGSGVAAVKITDTVKEVQRGVTVSKTIDRTKLWAVQTPQTFKLDVLKDAFQALGKKKAKVTDEAMAVELIGKQVRLVPACLSNIKITTPDDMRLAGALLKLN
jgi:2-C-methyl-D-erythritol 4-phosphate cytidylyltransferase